MIELNLLPDVKKEFIRAQRIRNTVISGAIIVSLVCGGLVALLAVFVYAGQGVIINNLKQQITENHTKLAGQQEINKYLAIQSQLAALDTAAGQRSVYGRVLDALPALNPAAPNNVTLYDFSINKADSSATMSGQAATFEVVNNFKNTLEKSALVYTDSTGKEFNTPLFPTVTSGVPALSEVNGKSIAAFNFTMTFAPEAFDPSNSNIKILVPKLVTSDSDQNAPKELFTTQSGGSGNGN
jgi:hypothetical protein